MLFGRLFIIRPVIRLRKSKMDVAGFQLQDTSSAAKLQKVEADDFEQVKSKPHSANLSSGETTRCSSYQNNTIKEQCLTEAPTNFRRFRSSSLILDYLGKKLGGNFSKEPEDMLKVEDSVDGPSTHVCTLTPSTQQILRKCFKDIHPSEIVDYHVHLAGHGDSDSGCSIHPSMKQWWKPLRRLKAAVFMFASQVPDLEGADIQYVSRLVRLIKNFAPLSLLPVTPLDLNDMCSLPRKTVSLPSSLCSLPYNTRYSHGKLCLLAFDAFYEKDGTRNEDKTTLYIPNEYAFRLGLEFPDCFHPVGSVNPYRHDALQELEKCASKGVTIIKWLPNSMGINPSDKECDVFYQKIKELNMALLIHVGDEHSLTAGFLDNTLGNPLLLRRPLSRGVKVIAAHCASEGNAVDFERSPARSVPCFDLLMRLMGESQYAHLLFADISAICGFKRIMHLKTLLANTGIHGRLVYGSDYPVPAVNLVVHTSKLLKLGLITGQECAALNELYHYNPLLFDFASKRLLRGPNNESFPVSVFKQHASLPMFKETGTPV